MRCLVLFFILGAFLDNVLDFVNDYFVLTIDKNELSTGLIFALALFRLGNQIEHLFAAVCLTCSQVLFYLPERVSSVHRQFCRAKVCP